MNNVHIKHYIYINFEINFLLNTIMVEAIACFSFSLSLVSRRVTDAYQLLYMESHDLNKLLCRYIHSLMYIEHLLYGKTPAWH